mgnify:CR=1 FL=1
MKLATFICSGKSMVGVVAPENDSVWPVESLPKDGKRIPDMLDVIRHYDSLLPVLQSRGSNRRSLHDVKLQAPIPRPTRNIMCVGKNYHEHAHEFSKSGFDSSSTSSTDAIPTAPIIFTKIPECVIANRAPIRYPAGISDSVDYEAELAVVIGRGGRGIRREDALKHVWGYTIVNDVTARDWQGRHKQWFLGKSFDTFCPMGPWIVTADELDIGDLNVRCWVNDELRQNANTRDLIFDVPTIIEAISAGITLFPGDVIATGTPAGVGVGFVPPKFLKPGDRVRIDISGIGTLTNTVEDG